MRKKRILGLDFFVILSISLSYFLTQPVLAQEDPDDILTTVNEAVKQYKLGDFSGAISNLDYATQLIRQKRSERMKALLPEPLSGWQAKPATAQALGTAVFGGGVTVSRDYFTEKGASLSIEMVSDSPVLQSIMTMLNNPMFAGAAGGMIKTIKRQRAIIKYDKDDRKGEVDIVVASRFMVTVKGQGVERDTLLKFAESVDFTALSKN
ncbi:MAG: hypothetical protein Q3M24_14055 [Candidatus Electrothrix aestuarii]|uniref:Uncharacterized protein n=1 Tax=Candidatus Electrothrix aestuarii TaxID=3062594 RepID=A0AAU8LQW4_9BACT|nr:hypothetical protein [Candidatus Electrothrix aestuarii]